jgi:hypothetical protein
MNERINKLFGQAMDQSIPETWTTLTHSQLSILKDKFAELLVRECIEVCKSRVGNSDYTTGRMHCVSDLKEHFGVDE